MPLLDRDTVIDRPVLLNRDGDDEQDVASDTDENIVGRGGGATVNGVEFENGSYDTVAASNLAAVLATGASDGEAYKNAFRNAAIQLHELKEEGSDISELSHFAAVKDIDLLNVNSSDIASLRSSVNTTVEVSEDDSDISDSDDTDSGSEEVSGEDEETTEVVDDEATTAEDIVDSISSDDADGSEDEEE